MHHAIKSLTGELLSNREASEDSNLYNRLSAFVKIGNSLVDNLSVHIYIRDSRLVWIDGSE